MSDQGHRSDPPAIIVGYNGAPAAQAALRWAAHEATTRQQPLMVVTTWTSSPVPPWALPSPARWSAAAVSRAEASAKEAREIVGDQVDVETRVSNGGAARELAGVSAEADLLVVGSSGHVGAGGWLGGSVSRHLLHRALCPVVVVGPEGHDLPVHRLVLSSTLDHEGEVFDFVRHWLQQRLTPVHVIASYALPALIPDVLSSVDPVALRESITAQNQEYVERLRTALPAEAVVTSEVDEGHPVEVLDRRAKLGDLIVVPRGSEHDAPFAHGGCPVCVV